MTHSKYRKAVEGILKASPEEALAHAREIRAEETPEHLQILEQKMISFRLALKIGNGRFLDEQELNPSSAMSSQMRAEAHFVRGMVFLHKENFKAAAEEFNQAAPNYVQAENIEKSLLSEFNSLIARATGELISFQQELNLCSELLQKAQSKNHHKIAALCLRQKSYSYFSSGRFLAALNEIKTALPLIEAHCPVSDYHLALVHAADCALESQQVDEAKVILDYLPGQIDSRVEFPLTYVLAKSKKQSLDLTLFDDINTHWKNRYEDYVERTLAPTSPSTQIQWDPKSYLLIRDGKHLVGKIKPQSLEGQFLKILMKGPQSKEFLSEALWSEFSSTENLDDRFFRLKNRLNQKLGELISFDGKNYFLSISIKWRS